MKVLIAWLVIMECACIGIAYINPTAYMVLTQDPRITYAYFTDEPSIIIDHKIAALLEQKFTTETNEFIFCIYGSQQQGIYHITRVDIPPIYYTSTTEIRHGDCPQHPSLLGTLHSHPESVCKLSPTDIQSVFYYNTTIMGVQCGPDTFGFFTQDDLLYSQPYEIQD